jgi:hypothetical protein
MLTKFLLWWLMERYEPKKISSKERMVIYKNLKLVDGFHDLLQRQVEAYKYKVLTAAGDDMKWTWFYKGAIFANQLHLKNMEKYWQMWQKEQETANKAYDRIKK